jgi:hypothetical protein
LLIFTNQLLTLALKFPLVSHVRCAGAIGILSYLAPTGKLFGVKTTLPPEGSQVCATEGSDLNYSRQLISNALPDWWAHSLKDLLPHSGAIGRFNGRLLSPPGGWIKPSEQLS